MKVLVLGAGGMLGSACYQVFAENEGFLTYGTLRTLEQTADYSRRRRDLNSLCQCA